MMSSFQGFQRLYAEADEKYSIAKPIVPSQRDSEEIDKLIQQSKNYDHKNGDSSSTFSNPNSATAMQHPNIKKLRALVYHVKATEIAHHESNQVLTKRPRTQTDTSYDYFLTHDSYLNSWESDVKEMMAPDDSYDHEMIVDSDNNNLKRNMYPSGTTAATPNQSIFIPNDLLMPTPRLPNEMIPYSCFDPSVVDESFQDNLDVLIPNVRISTDTSDDKLSADQSKPLDFLLSSPNTATTASATTTQPPKQMPKSITANKDLTTFQRKKLLAEKKKLRLMNVNLGTESVKSLDKIFGTKRSRDEMTTNNKKGNRSVISSLHHTSIALTHRNTKPDLREADLRHFHRPHFPSNASFTIVVKPEKKEHNASTFSAPQRLLAADQTERQNVSLLEGSIVVMEYIEERPPIIQNPGMVSAIMNYEQASNTNNEQADDLLSANHADSAQSKAPGQIVSSSSLWSLIKTYRLPRHVVLLLKQRENNALNSELENIFTSRSDFGERMLLSNEDESPFLGYIPSAGPQQGMVNNLFKAPVFKQENTLSNDFLLVPMNERGNSVKYLLRAIPKVFTVAQIEPQRVVPRPVQKITDIQEKFYLLAAARCFAMDISLSGLEYARVQNVILKYCAKESRSPHKSHHREKLKLIISKVATESRDGSIMKWYPKDFYEGADSFNRGVSGSELERMYSEEELAKAFTPEDVCLQESCNATEYLLMDLGINRDIELPVLEDWLQRMQRLIAWKEDQYITFKQRKQKYKDNLSAVHGYNRHMKIQMNSLKKLYDTLRIGEFIFERLVNAPWNTTEAYYACMLDRDNKTEVMEVASLDCDPSGSGEGFSYRHVVKLQTGKAVGKAQQERLQGTDKDLRKLTNVEMKTMLIKFGVREEELRKIQRWDMVHLVRDFMNQAAVAGAVSTSLKKFVRIEGVFGSALNESNFKQQCEVIWARQLLSLQYKHSLALDLLAPSYNTVDPSSSTADDIEKAIERSLRLREDEKILLTADELNPANKAAAAKPVDNEVRNLEEVLQDINTSQTNKIAARIVGVDHEAESSATAGTNPQHRPSRVVKRVTKTYHDDGNKIIETIKVEFIVSELECRRVEDATLRERKLREMKKHNPLLSSRPGRRMSFDDELPEEDHMFTTSSGTLGLNFGALKRKVSEAAAMDDHYGEDSYLRQQYRTTKRGNVAVSKKSRLPRVELAARFEKEIFDLWDMKKAHIFRFPVSKEITRYYEVITRPICLMDIREKISEYKYSTAKELLDDVTLMAENAELFNGKASDIAKNGWKLVNKLKRGLAHDREHFGVEGDTIRILEEAIQKK
jgi:hypothetical protein